MSTPPPRAREGPATRGHWKAWGLLLLVLTLLVGLALIAGGRGLFDFEARRQDTERDVLRTAEDLVRREGAFFGDFVPYLRSALEAASPATARPAFDGVWPRGKVLLRTPSFRWTGTPPGSACVVTLLDEAGETLWTRAASGTSCAWPNDAEPLYREASYVWTVAPDDGAGEAGGAGGAARTAFRVEAEQEVVRWERRKELLAKRVRDEGVRQVLSAEIALRRGWVWEAWTLVGERLEEAPKDGYARALQGYIQRFHGLVP